MKAQFRIKYGLLHAARCCATVFWYTASKHVMITASVIIQGEGETLMVIIIIIIVFKLLSFYLFYII